MRSSISDYQFQPMKIGLSAPESAARQLSKKLSCDNAHFHNLEIASFQSIELLFQELTGSLRLLVKDALDT
jgi:hypothetical protein